MRINKGHRREIINYAYKTLVTKPVVELEQQCRDFLNELYQSWYDVNIKPYISSPLFPLLHTKTEVNLADTTAKKQIQFRIPNSNRYNSFIYVNTAAIKNTSMYYDRNCRIVSSWTPQECPITLSNEQSGKYQDLLQACNKLIETIRAQMATIEATIEQFNSFAQLQKLAPRLYDIIPPDMKKAHQEYATNKKKAVRQKREILLADEETIQKVATDFTIAKMLED